MLAKVDTIAPLEVMVVTNRNVLEDADSSPYRRWLLLAALLASLPAVAWPQTQLATIFGTISDPSGAVIPGVAVTIVNQSTGLRREVLTRSAGEYRFT